MDFNVIRQAGITQLQFGALVGVSRLTVSTWVHGYAKPRAALRPRVAKIVAALDTAVRRGELPLEEPDRDARLRELLERVERSAPTLSGVR